MRVLAGNATASSPGPRLTPPPARFHTVVGQRYTIALQYATGKDVKSPRTGQISRMYTLTSGEKAYFDLDVAAAIDSLTLAPGQPFTVCHHGSGTWDIERADTERAAPPPSERPAVPNVQSVQYTQPARSPAAQPPRYWGNESQPQQSDTATVPPPPAPPQLMNGAGEDLPAILARHYEAAIAITARAMETARQKGVIFAPTHEGLQACAATLFIAETRRQS